MDRFLTVQDGQHFEYIFNSILQASVPSRPKLTSLMGDISDKMEEQIKSTLSKTRRICVTSDIWSSLNQIKSYLGVAAHCYDIDAETNAAFKISKFCDHNF